MPNYLNIVDENDEIIGQETRDKIHRDGLLHREIHVDFITSNKEVIFQHRSKDKETFPDLLDATVGGHVEIGDSYEQSAVKETEEETGVIIKPGDLIPIKKIKKRSEDKITNRINYVFSYQYVYVYRDDIRNLKVEREKALGFEVWPLDKLLNLTDEKKAKFIPYVFNFAVTELPKVMEKILRV